VRRTLRTLATISVLAILVGIVGYADHRHKSTEMQRADVAWWYCANDHVGCGDDAEAVEHRADRIEASWQTRERAYTLLIGGLIGAAAMSLIAALPLRGSERAQRGMAPATFRREATGIEGQDG
jgi:hypothetical protein